MTKYKVGDIVVITSGLASSYHGNIYTVVRVADGFAWIDIFEKSGEGNAIYDDWARLATPLEEVLK